VGDVDPSSFQPDPGGNDGTTDNGQNGTNSPITWPSTNSDAILKKGFEQLYTVIQDTSKNEVQAINNVKDSVDGVTIAVNSVKTSVDAVGTSVSALGPKLDAINGNTAGITNGLGLVVSAINGMGNNLSNALAGIGTGTGTNIFSGGETGVVSAVTKFHFDNTNLLGQINSKLGATNDAYALSATMTNASGNVGIVQGLLGDANTAAEGAVDGFGGAPTGGAEGGSGSLTIPWIGGSLNLDPNVQFPGTTSTIFAMTSAFALFVFARRVGDMFFKVSQTFSTVRTGGVPNLPTTILGTGGNFIGAALPPIIATVIIGAWVGVFTLFFSIAGSYISSFQALSTVMGGMSGTALYLVTSFFPVSLMVSLAWTYILLQFSMGKIVMVVAGVCRFLIGK